MKKNLFPNYQPKHDRLVCVDSDGCVFDTMELKHKECFCPATIHAWGLQPISKYVREAWEYCNLYSKDRGRSRFHEIVLVFDLLARREELKEYDFQLPDITPLRQWVETAPLLNNEELAKQKGPVMEQALEWSLEMNRRAAEMVKGVPPFPGVRKSFERLSKHADIVIVSATPREALDREWNEHGLMEYITLLCAQEDGSKKDCIASVKEHYDQNKVLMMGDAPGDQEAAEANGILCYPILPGREIQSWREFCEEGADCFLEDRFAGAYQQKLIERFSKCLPSTPPWESK